MIKASHFGTYGIIIHNDKILMVKKSRGPYKGKFDLPGGKIEFGESIEEALIREIIEETNLEVKSYAFHSTDSLTVKYLNSLGEYSHLHHIGIIYSVIVKNYQIPLKTDVDTHDSLGAIWIRLDDYDLIDFSPFAANVLKNYAIK